MAGFTYRNIVNRPLSYAEIDSNFQQVEILHDQAQEAVAASAVNGNMYQSIALGLANTVDGEYFTVPSLLVDEYLNLYLNSSGSEVLVKTYLIPEVSNFVVKDASDNIEVNSVSLTITQGNPTIDSILTDNGDGLVRKSTVSEFEAGVIGDKYLKKVYTEKVNAVATTSLDIDDGTIQVLNLTANSTLSLSITSGQSLTLHINGGDTYSVTWPTITWIGGDAPILTSNDVVVMWMVSGVLYGAYSGSV